jgi:hypothetical protein
MDEIGMKRRFIALTAICAVVLQMFLPFASLASAAVGSGSVICTSTAPANNSGGDQSCSCAAGCGICSPHMPAILPAAPQTSMLPQIHARGVDLQIEFQVAAVRFAPQAARPPPSA